LRRGPFFFFWQAARAPFRILQDRPTKQAHKLRKLELEFLHGGFVMPTYDDQQALERGLRQLQHEMGARPRDYSGRHAAQKHILRAFASSLDRNIRVAPTLNAKNRLSREGALSGKFTPRGGSEGPIYF
jgi:hypothetical protein